MADATKTIAVVVGIDNYGTDEWYLPGPAADAVRFTIWLLRQGVQPKNIWLCTTPGIEDPALQKIVREQSDATVAKRIARCARLDPHRDQIDKLFNATLRRRQGDLLVVFWGGHGVMDREGKRRLFYADASADYKLNLDFNALSVSLQSQYFVRLPQQVFIIDACANRFIDRKAVVGLPGSTYPIGLDCDAITQWTLLAASPGQEAGNLPALGTGVFSQEFHAVLPQGRLASWPPDWAGLMTAVDESLQKCQQEGRPQTPSWRFLGPGIDLPRGRTPASDPKNQGRDPALVSRVDRRHQTERAQAFFSVEAQQLRNRPHVVILYGDPGEAHSSLVQRIIEDIVSRTVRSRLGIKSIPAPEKITWPSGVTDLDELKVVLAENLLQQALNGAEVNDRTCLALARYKKFRDCGMAILRHELYVTDWSESQRDLLTWYVDKYWEHLPQDPDTPHFLIFIKMVSSPHLARPRASDLWKGSLKQQMCRDLGAIAKSASGCRRIVLDELKPVPLDEVEKWASEEVCAPDEEIGQMISSVFTGTDGPIRELRMEDLQKKLRSWMDPLKGSTSP